MVNEMHVERIGITEGRKTDYQIRIDGSSIGRIKIVRQRQADRLGKGGYDILWMARRGPYDSGIGFQTQTEAEAFLTSWAK